MVKRLILCADNRSPYTEGETYYKYCIGISQVYAQKYNADFVFDELKSVPDGRHWSWARILLFAKYFPKYDEILWLDSDATIINHDLHVFSLLKTTQSAGWPRDETTPPIIYACRDSPIRGTEKAKQICCGIMLIDCTNKTRVKDMLNDWWNDIPDAKFKQGFPYEQSVINDVWYSHPVKRNYVKNVDLDSFFNFSDDQVFIHLTSNYYLPSLQLHEAKKYAARLVSPRKKKIGIFVRQQNFYASGCGQNCVFIKQSLELLGYKVHLLVENYDRTKQNLITPNLAIFYTDFNGINVNEYDIFVFGSVVPSSHARQKIGSAKTVMFHPMNSMDALHIDTFAYPKKADTVPLFESSFHQIADEIWLTNNHEQTAKTYIEMLNNYKKPIKTIPLTWAPLFVSTSKQQVSYESRKSTQVEFVIIEPNSSFCKSSWFPLMIAEYVYKQTKSVRAVHLFSAQEDRSMINTLQLAKDNKIQYRPRIQINEIISQFAKGDAHVIFLSHQVNIPLNYAYFDVLSAGFPFIHNSPMLLEKGQGYFYTSLETALSAVQTIMTSFNPTEELKKAESYLNTIHPGNASVLAHFSNLVPAPVPALVSAPALVTAPPPRKKICIVVLTIDKERENWMRKQLQDMNIPYPIEFFQGFTPNTSKDYLATKEENALEDNGTLCCLRSYAALFSSWSSKSYDYLITLEDDITISKDFVSQVEATIEVMEKEPSIDFVNLGMLLLFNPEELKNSTKKGRIYFDNLPSIWGGQALMFKPETVNEIAKITHFPTVKEVRESINSCKSRKLYRNRSLYIQIDALLPTLFKQAVEYPPIAIESFKFRSSREHDKHNETNKKFLANHPMINLDFFY